MPFWIRCYYNADKKECVLCRRQLEHKLFDLHCTMVIINVGVNSHFINGHHTIVYLAKSFYSQVPFFLELTSNSSLQRISLRRCSSLEFMFPIVMPTGNRRTCSMISFRDMTRVMLTRAYVLPVGSSMKKTRIGRLCYVCVVEPR